MENKDKLFIGLFVAAIIGFAFLISPVAASNPPQEDGTGPYRDYTMKVAPIEPTIVTEGTLFFKTQCGHNVFTDKVIIQEVEPVTGTVVVSNGLVAPEVVAQNFAPKGGEREFAIRADGTLDLQLPAGIFTATVKDGNSGQPEVVLFEIKPAQTTFINVIGHAFSGAEAQIAKITITEATYGAFVTVVDQAAYDEFVPAVTQTIHHAATPATGYPCSSYYPGHVHANQVGGTDIAPNRFTYHGHTYQITGNSHDQAFIVTPGTPAYDEVNVLVPAHTVHHAAVTHQEGSFIDVTAQVQAAVDAGVTSFVFNNAVNPGGILDTDGNLIVQIDDPAYGIVKDVHIEYDGGIVDTKEYQTINL